MGTDSPLGLLRGGCGEIATQQIAIGTQSAIHAMRRNKGAMYLTEMYAIF